MFPVTLVLHGKFAVIHFDVHAAKDEAFSIKMVYRCTDPSPIRQCEKLSKISSCGFSVYYTPYTWNPTKISAELIIKPHIPKWHVEVMQPKHHDNVGFHLKCFKGLSKGYAI